MPDTLYRRRPEYAFVRSGRQVRGYRYEQVTLEAIEEASELVGISVDTAMMFIEAIGDES